MSKPRIRLPASARPGEVITIKTLISHPMETGRRRDGAGQLVPRRIIHRFACRFEDELVIELTFEPAMSANPFLEFTARVDRSGRFSFEWEEDAGTLHRAEAAITVA